MTSVDSTLLLHIVNGDMAAGSFLHAFGAGDSLLINRDVLSCGPLPRSIRVAAWQKARLDFWRATLAHLRHTFGVDQPVWLQLLHYIAALAQGDFGFSYRQNMPVLQAILQRLPATLLLINRFPTV